MQALADVLIAFSAFVGLSLVGLLCFAGWKYYVVLRDLRNEIKVMNRSISGLPALMDGIKNVCVELSGNTLKMSGAAEALRRGLLSEETSDPRRPGFIPYDSDKANAAYDAYKIAEAEAVADLGDTFVVD